MCWWGKKLKEPVKNRSDLAFTTHLKNNYFFFVLQKKIRTIVHFCGKKKLQPKTDKLKTFA
jgi:hypothetical protein